MSRGDGFRHDALLYGTDDEFLQATTEFVGAGVAEGASTLVVVDARRLRQLRGAFGSVAGVELVDVAELGPNPARLIPAWQQFVDRHDGTGRPLRGIAEPIRAERSTDEIVELRHHETLLNIAFATGPTFWLLCLYDAATLDPGVIDGARGTHPVVGTTGRRRRSPEFPVLGPHDLLDEPLPHPPAAAETLRFTDIDAVRRFVRAHAAAAKLSTSAVADAVLAVDEVGTNALRHGGDHGHLAIWRRGDVLVCQVDGGGQITDPLVGRRRPDDTQIGGRGLWIVNQLCRLVQIRSSPRGSTVRLHLGDSADRP